MKRTLLLIVANMLLLAVTCRAQHKKAKALTTLPAIDVYDLSGKHVNLAELGKNKVVLIDCWFIPCPPCSREAGMLHKLYAKYKNDKNVCFITLCRTDSSIVKKFLAKDKSVASWVKLYQNNSKLTNFDLPVYFIPGCNMKIYTGTPLAKFDPDDKTKCPDAIFSFRGYPTAMIFNKAGKMVLKKTGFVSEEEFSFSAQIEGLLNPSLASK